MILADLLNREGSVISHNWFYSTELKVVNLQWFYRLGLLLFPDDWHLARTFGMAIALALYAAAMLFFVKCAGLGRPASGWSARCSWPSGSIIWFMLSMAGTIWYIPSFICWCWRLCCAA